MSQFDVVVVGLGAVGSSALFALAGSGAPVIGIDRFNPPHAFGSSHGETRITRQAIGEGKAYVPLVVRSNQILDVLGSEFGEPLIERMRFLLIARNDATTSCHGKPGFLATTLAAAEKFTIPHECLTSSEVVARFPQFAGLDGDEEAYYEPGGGYVRPEQTIAALLSGAKARGAIIKTGTQVLRSCATAAASALKLRISMSWPRASSLNRRMGVRALTLRGRPDHQNLSAGTPLVSSHRSFALPSRP